METGTTAEQAEVLRVGAEPVLAWTRDEESDLPRLHIMAPGWRFRFGNGYLCLGNGARISATLTRVRDEPLVPSDEPPDIENGVVWIAGYTLGELRDIRVVEGEGWTSLRARLWYGRKSLWPQLKRTVWNRHRSQR